MPYRIACRDTYNYTLRYHGKVVYQGITNDPERRIQQHIQSGKRFTSFTVSFPCSKDIALDRERSAIDNYRYHHGRRPRYNKV
jgi:predicted GIY-YIG superfamily endonuclease